MNALGLVESRKVTEVSVMTGSHGEEGRGKEWRGVERRGVERRRGERRGGEREKERKERQKRKGISFSWCEKNYIFNYLKPMGNF